MWPGVNGDMLVVGHFFLDADCSQSPITFVLRQFQKSSKSASTTVLHCGVFGERLCTSLGITY